jgi:hypothetical protein
MGFVRKADFYYGAMLSGLVNNGIAPAIIEPGDSRRIYSLTTDKGNFRIYAKYRSAPEKRQNTDTQRWQFTFSPEEIQYIRTYTEDGHKLFFALICGQEDLQNSEIAFLSLDEVKDCLDVDYERPSYYINIKVVKGSRVLRAHGTGRSDLLNDKDNTIRIQRNYLPLFVDESQTV